MVAAELHRSEKAMRFAFSSWSCRETPWVRALLAGKIKMGQRVLFPADVVAAVMLQGHAISPWSRGPYQAYLHFLFRV